MPKRSYQLPEDDDSDTAPTDPFDLGSCLGRWQALGFVAGRCSAADVVCLREIRDQKLYRSRTRTWALFCTRYLGLHRSQADRLLQYLAEFGPNFFHLTAIVRVSPPTYLLIAHAVREDAIQVREIRVPLIPENAGRILRAVRELRFQSGIDARSSPSGSDGSWKVAAQTLDAKQLRERSARLAKRLESLVAELTAFATLNLAPPVAALLSQAVQRAVNQLTALKRGLQR